MRIICIRFPKPDGTHTYWIGTDAEAMRKDGESFGGDPARGEVMDMDRVEAEWPDDCDIQDFYRGRDAAQRGCKSYSLNR